MDWQSARGSRSALLGEVSRLICAPELRTRQTAELFGDRVEIVEALRDCDFGRWRGARIKDLQKTDPGRLQHWIVDPDAAPHGGESVTQVIERLAAWLSTLESTPGHVIAVTHPFIIRAALAHVLQSPAFNQIDVQPLSTIELRFSGHWRLHLGDNLEGTR